MSILCENIGKNIKKYRKEIGLKKYELAQKIGVNAITMGKIENGLDAMKVSYIEKASEVLNVPVEKIIFGDDAIILNNSAIEKLNTM